MASDLSPGIQSGIALLSEAFLAGRAPATERWRATGLLADRQVERRYGNVPAEAFPFLDSGADGCHYALWIDDAAQAEEPPVVWVSPMDGTPETIQLVAKDVRTFLEIVNAAGLWRDGDEGRVLEASDSAMARRRDHVLYETADGMGVVATFEPPAQRPLPSTLRRWRWEAPHEFRAAIEEWLAGGTPALALAAARDVIADHDAAGLAGFEEIYARIYLALGRSLHALVAGQRNA